MSTTTFLDPDALNALPATAFRAARPYPWITTTDFIRPEAYQRLVETLPDPALFQANFGHVRKYGQQSHDRYSLVYDPALPIDPAWHAFVAELNGPVYRAFVERLTGRRRLRLLLHWHYTPAGCSVSPHCDAKRKLGSQIFYFNTAADWDPGWGGGTVVLDDHGACDSDSAPGFDDLETVTTSPVLGNHSFVFMRRGNSWHGVRPLTCPPGALRKVFIVVFENWSLPWRVADTLRGLRGLRPSRTTATVLQP
ncbi:MAG: hypothetical protein KDK06_05370 [Gammaproteobacteria bacterium]|nr:hypothetical protein [Gammaproteobacteria bacterium]